MQQIFIGLVNRDFGLNVIHAGNSRRVHGAVQASAVAHRPVAVVPIPNDREARDPYQLMPKKNPDPKDVEVGRRVRAFRLNKGLSQEKLGGALGITFQQVQKYERGTNRIGAGRLQRIAEILGVPVSEFFAPGNSAAAQTGSLYDLVDTAAALRLLRAYARIPDPQVRQAVTTLVEKIAGA